MSRITRTNSPRNETGNNAAGAFGLIPSILNSGCRDWQAQAKGLIRAELARRQLGYRELAEKLAAIGVKEIERNLSNKINRGSFTVVFLLQCLEAIGVNNIHLDSN
jgi:hypothetical protein